MQSVLAVPFFLAAGLLAWGGATKLLRPQSAVQALAAAGLPHGRTIARSLGLAELAVGLGALVEPAPATALSLAVLYAAFSAFLGLAMATGAPLSSCGCFGSKEVRPNGLHLSLTILAAALGLLVAVAGPGMAGVLATANGTPLHGVPFLVGLAAAGYLVALSVVYLPMTMRAYRRPAEG